MNLSWSIVINFFVFKYIYIERERERPDVFTGNSDRTFTDTNPVIKKDDIPINTIIIIKTPNENYANHYRSHEEDIKSETRVEEKYRVSQ